MIGAFTTRWTRFLVLVLVTACASNTGLTSAPPTWMGLTVQPEGPRAGYDRDAFGSAYGALEDEIIASLPKRGRQIFTPYTCTLYDIRADGTAATDIEHIVALAEAYESWSCQIPLPRVRRRHSEPDHCGTDREPESEVRQGCSRVAAPVQSRLVRSPHRRGETEVRDVRGRGRARRPDGNAQGRPEPRCDLLNRSARVDP